MLRLQPFASLYHYPTCGFKLIGLCVDCAVIQGMAFNFTPFIEDG
jgi:hypothetical protein